jgi:hypothetical protein
MLRGQIRRQIMNFMSNYNKELACYENLRKNEEQHGGEHVHMTWKRTSHGQFSTFK